MSVLGAGWETCIFLFTHFELAEVPHQFLQAPATLTSTELISLLAKLFGLNDPNYRLPAKEKDALVIIGLAAYRWNQDVKSSFMSLDFNVVAFDEVSCSREVMSETAGTSSRAATRGRSDFADEECAETTCV